MRLVRALGWVALMSGMASCASPPGRLVLKPVEAAAVVPRAAAQGLVPLSTAAPGVRVHLAYGTAENFAKRVLYPVGFPAMLHRDAAAKLARAQATLARQGYGLLVWDAYRPPEVQWQLFQIFADDRYVSDPRKKWSRHCYGRAVDLTLTDAGGRPVRMPTAFDDFSTRASARYTGGDPVVARHVATLQQAMLDAGFKLYADEWWHFNDDSDPASLKRPPIWGKSIGLPVR